MQLYATNNPVLDSNISYAPYLIDQQDLQRTLELKSFKIRTVFRALF